MAYDFYRNRQYTIDYNLLRNFIRKLTIFKVKSNEVIYIESWIKLLKSSEKDFDLEKKWSSKKAEFDRKFGRYEFFEATIPFLNIKIFFDIEEVKLYSKKITTIHEFNIKEELNTRIGANPKSFFEKQVPSNYNLSDPILVAPISSGFLVIDGNHRLGYYIDNHKESITYKIITQEELIENSFFLSNFDKYIYILINELMSIRLLEVRDLEKLAKSFLCTGKPILSKFD